MRKADLFVSYELVRVIPAVAGEATIIMISRAANHKAFVSFDTLVLLSKNSALTFSEPAQCKNCSYQFFLVQRILTHDLLKILNMMKYIL